MYIHTHIQTSAMLELTVIKDTEPEEAEHYTVLLSQPDGGATLGRITQKEVIIEGNDAPYGLLEIYSAGTKCVIMLIKVYGVMLYTNLRGNVCIL